MDSCSVKSSLGKGLLYKKHEPVRIFDYSDSGYAGDKEDRKSTIGYWTFVGENLVTWRSMKQGVFKSSEEAEHRAMARTVCEMMWPKNLLLELDFRQPEPMHVY